MMSLLRRSTRRRGPRKTGNGNGNGNGNGGPVEPTAPDTISGLRVWLDASNEASRRGLGSLNTAKLAEWFDDATQAAGATQGSNPARPTLLLEAEIDASRWLVRFDNTNHFMNGIITGLDISTPYSVIVCAAEKGSSGQIFTGTSDPEIIIAHGAETAFDFYVFVSPNTVIAGNLGLRLYVGTALVEAGGAVRLDGAETVGDLLPGDLSGFKIAGNSNIDVCGILIYDRRLPTEELEGVEAWMGERYSVLKYIADESGEPGGPEGPEV